MEPNPLNTDLKICSSASLDVGLSAALQYHQNSYVKIIRNVIYRMDPFCICQQAGSDRPCTYFSCSVAHPNGFPPEYSIVATFEVVNGHPQIYGWLEILDGKDHIIICVLTDKQFLCLFYATPDNTLMLRAIISGNKVFDGTWHKTALSVRETNAKLLLACQEVSFISVHKAISAYRN